jgi:hypothetical protein
LIAGCQEQQRNKPDHVNLASHLHTKTNETPQKLVSSWFHSRWRVRGGTLCI